MDINVEHTAGPVPVTILQIRGDLDGSNYQELITKAREVCQTGTRAVLLDLSEMPYMSSAGLVALHSIAKLLQGEEPPDPEAGWGAFRDAAADRDRGPQPQLKLLNPQSRVDEALEMTGFKAYFEVHSDLQAALASF